MSSSGSLQYLNDVWSSYDQGAHWSQVTAAAAFAPRTWFGAVSHGAHILVVGGATYAPILRLNDVWKSVDGGAQWTLVTAVAGFTARYGFSFMSHDSLSTQSAANLHVTQNVFSLHNKILLVAGSTCEARCTQSNTSNAACDSLAGMPGPGNK